MALLEPFIDTVVICTMTALVIVIFNFSGFFEYGGDGSGVVFIDGQAFEGATFQKLHQVVFRHHT